MVQAASAVLDAAGLVPPPAAAAAAPACAPLTIRDYAHATDYPAVLKICRGVFGGNDPLLRSIAGLTERPGVRLFVAEGGGGAEALIGCHHADDVLFVFGARTREEARGRGLGARLLAHAEQHGRSLPGVGWSLSTTALVNEAMCRLFDKHGFATIAEVDIWPRQCVVKEAVRRAAAGGASGEAPLLSALPAEAAAQLRQAGEVAVDLLPRWQACTSAEQLLPLQRALRRSRAAELGADLACGAVAWLPYDYKLELLGSAALQQKAQASGPEGLLWMLGPGEGGCGAAAEGEVDAAVLVFAKSNNHNTHNSWLAGVVAGSPRALASAVLKAVQLQPACCEFYVDRCWDRVAAPPWLAAAAGRPHGGYAEDDGPSHYVLSGKRLS